VLYLLHVGVMEQMGEEAQRSLADALAKQLTSQDMSPHMMVASLRTLASLLATLGEVRPRPSIPSCTASWSSLHFLCARVSSQASHRDQLVPRAAVRQAMHLFFVWTLAGYPGGPRGAGLWAPCVPVQPLPRSMCTSCGHPLCACGLKGG